MFFTGCQAEVEKKSEPVVKLKKHELALITDFGTIDDKSYNQGAWEGLKKFGEEKDISYKYYKPSEEKEEAYLETIGFAVEGGAKLVVCIGYLFETTVYRAQKLYPQIQFILLDGEPHEEGSDVYETDENVTSILYAEEQVGFLAGYAAVKDGYTKLGFMGGMEIPAVVSFGYGFVQGADYAGKEMGLSTVEVLYHYTGHFEANQEVEEKAISWYEQGTEVIFSCGGAAGKSVIKAAEIANAKVIGVDVDQSADSKQVITSAIKMLSLSVYETIVKAYEGDFPGGKTIVLDASNKGIGLSMETSRFSSFSMENYENIYKKLESGEVVPLKASEIEEVTQLPREMVSVVVEE